MLLTSAMLWHMTWVLMCLLLVTRVSAGEEKEIHIKLMGRLSPVHLTEKDIMELSMPME